jgi:hypothetical protein
MLKFIYRSIIITILSVCLITEAVAASGAVSNVTNSDGSETLTQHVTFDGFKDRQDFMADLEMLLVSAITTRLISYTKMTWDMIMAEGAGVAYMLGDASELALTKDVEEKEFNIIKKSTEAPDSAQLAALQKMRDAMQKALDGLQTKRNMQDLAKTLYYAAAAWAIGSFVVVATAIIAKAAAWAVTLAGSVNAAACTAFLMNAVIPASTALLLPPLFPYATACAAPEAAWTLTSVGSGALLVLAVVAVYFAADNQHGSKGSAGRLLFAGLGFAALAPLLTGFATFLDMFMATDPLRAVSFAFLGMRAERAAHATQENIDKVQGQIGELDAIINSLKGTDGGSLNNATAAGTPAPLPESNYTAPAFEPSANPILGTCALSSGNSKCPTLTSKMPKQLDPNFPADITSAGAGLASGFDNLLGGPITPTRFAQSGLSRFTSCSGSACAINKMLAREQGKLNAALSKAGKPTIDFNKLQNQFGDGLRKAMQTGLDKMGQDKANQLYASMHSGAGALGGGKAAGLDKKTGAGKVFAKGGIGANAKGGAATPPKAPTFNFKEEAKPAEAVAAPAASIDAYDLKGDINKDSGASIFQILSERYIKSGYPKLLEEIPAATPAPVPLAPEKK